MSNTLAEELMSAAISSYRLIPALKILVDGDEMLKGSDRAIWIKKAAYTGVVAWLKTVFGDTEGCANLLQEFLQRNKEWIRYAYSDMLQYNELLGGYTHLAGTHYMPRMLEEAHYYDWNWDAFRVSALKEFSIVDIGCGPFSHFHTFHNANPATLKNYCGVDKRDMGPTALRLEKEYNTDEKRSHDNACEVAFMKCDVSNNSDKIIDIGLDCEVLFFGEMLHCVRSPLNVLTWCIDAMESVQIVKILELKEDGAGLSICFDFHMRVHSPGQAFGMNGILYCANKLGWQVKMEEASSQHEMYTLTRG